MGFNILPNEETEFIGRAKINSMIVSSDPDWALKDAEISFKLIRLFMSIANKVQLRDMHFSIAEKSDDEIDPHYLIDVTTGDVLKNDICSNNIDVEYIAKVEEKSHFGIISLFIKFCGTEEERDFVGRILLEEYIKLLEFYYPEFKTTYFEPDEEEKYIPYQYLLRNNE